MARENVDWMYLVQDRVQRKDIMDTAIKVLAN
jgi:hypothetical protein